MGYTGLGAKSRARVEGQGQGPHLALARWQGVAERHAGRIRCSAGVAVGTIAGLAAEPTDELGVLVDEDALASAGDPPVHTATHRHVILERRLA